MKPLLLLSVLALIAAASSLRADPAPVFLLQWGTQGSGDSQFQNPSGIAVGPDGRVYAGDRGNHRVQIFDGNGSFLGKWSCGSCDPIDLAVEPSGNVVVADLAAGQLLEYTGGGTFLRTIGTPGTGPGQIDGPWEIDVDTGGNIHVVNNYASYNYDRYAPDGTLAATWLVSTTYGHFAPGYGCAVASNGDVFVSYVFLGGPNDPGEAGISRRTASGALVPTFVPAVTVAFAVGLETDPADNLYFARGEQIMKLDGTSGAVLTTWGSAGSGPGQFNNPVDVALDVSGNIYVVDAGNSRVQKFGSGVTSAHPISWGRLKTRYR